MKLEEKIIELNKAYQLIEKGIDIIWKTLGNDRQKAQLLWSLKKANDNLMKFLIKKIHIEVINEKFNSIMENIDVRPKRN